MKLNCHCDQILPETTTSVHATMPVDEGWPTVNKVLRGHVDALYFDFGFRGHLLERALGTAFNRQNGDKQFD